MQKFQVMVYIITILGIVFFSAANSIETNYSKIDFEAKKPFIIKEITQNLPQKDTIMYTDVPRGIILSISQEELFCNNSDEISIEGKLLLSCIAKLLKTFNNDCTIEAHSDELLSGDKIYRDDWEISIVRATKIAKYLSTNFGIENNRLFPIGFGKIMPFRENVAPINFSNNRIDFVIFDYTVSR